MVFSLIFFFSKGRREIDTLNFLTHRKSREEPPETLPMQTREIGSIYIAGKPSMETFTERAHTFVNNAIGEAFNPRRKALVDTKLDEAEAILEKAKKTPPKRKN